MQDCTFVTNSLRKAPSSSGWAFEIIIWIFCPIKWMDPAVIEMPRVGMG